MSSLAPIIQALDVKTSLQAIERANEFTDKTKAVKLGLEFFCANGPEGIKQVGKETGKEVFLDIKLHDIPNTVYGAVTSCADIKPFMITVHLGGGRAMLKKAVEGAEFIADKTGKKPLILGVSVLTSLGREDMEEIGYEHNCVEQTIKMAALARSCGLDGVVCSGQEIEALKTNFGDDLKLVVPGIRVDAENTQDQKRVISAKEASRLGADYLVIGRDIANV